MTKIKTLFQTTEKICGYLPKDREWVRYDGILTIMDGGKSPVKMKMKFVPPHPPWFEMPLEKTINAENLTEVYVKIVKFYKQYGIEFK